MADGFQKQVQKLRDKQDLSQVDKDLDMLYKNDADQIVEHLDDYLKDDIDLLIDKETNHLKAQKW